MLYFSGLEVSLVGLGFKFEWHVPGVTNHDLIYTDQEVCRL